MKTGWARGRRTGSRQEKSLTVPSATEAWPRRDARWRRGWTGFVDQGKVFTGKARGGGDRHPRVLRHRLIDGPANARPWGREALLPRGREGRRTDVGRANSVAFGKQIGMGYVRPDLAPSGTRLKLPMFAELWERPGWSRKPLTTRRTPASAPTGKARVTAQAPPRAAARVWPGRPRSSGRQRPRPVACL